MKKKVKISKWRNGNGPHRDYSVNGVTLLSMTFSPDSKWEDKKGQPTILHKDYKGEFHAVNPPRAEAAKFLRTLKKADA